MVLVVGRYAISFARTHRLYFLLKKCAVRLVPVDLLSFSKDL